MSFKSNFLKVLIVNLKLFLLSKYVRNNILKIVGEKYIRNIYLKQLVRGHQETHSWI